MEYRQLLLDQYSSDDFILSSGFPFLFARIAIFPIATLQKQSLKDQRIKNTALCILEDLQ